MFQARGFMNHIDDRLGGVTIGVGTEDKGQFLEYLRAAHLTAGERTPRLVPVHRLTDQLEQGRYVITGLELRDANGLPAAEFDDVLVDVPYDNPDPNDVDIIEVDGVSLSRSVDAAEAKLERNLKRIANDGVHLPDDVAQDLDGDFLLQRSHFDDALHDRSKWGIVGPKHSDAPIHLPLTYDQFDAIWTYHTTIARVLDPSQNTQ